MIRLRRLILQHRRGFALLLVLALAMKLILPSGLMLAGGDRGTITVQICSGYGPATLTTAMPGASHGADKSGHQGKDMPCAYAALGAPSLAAADPVLLAAAIAFIVTMLVRAMPGAPAAAPAYLRPPLRGPPVPA